MIFGKESMAFETSSSTKYKFLGQLIGQALTPTSVAKCIPAIQDSAERAVNKMLLMTSTTKNKEVVQIMSSICTDFTLDVAWRQIIGLQLSSNPDDIDKFHTAVQIWIKTAANFLLYIMFPLPRWFIRQTEGYKSKQYLTKQIEQRIDELESSGIPDGSTLSSMIFATYDDEDDGQQGQKKLSRKQIIDNVFLLILAGTETSSSTLTNAMLLIGVDYPNCWNKLVAEQQQIVNKYGPNLTREQLDMGTSPYLDAVIKETMRLLPISGGGIRTVDETIVLDGYQIPKKWWTMYNIALTHEQDPKTYLEDNSHMTIYTGFNPERWLDPKTCPTKTEYIPYGAGYRFCLGHNLANAEMRTFLAVLARKLKGFDLKTDTKNIKWKEGIIITPKDGVVVSATSK